MKAGAGRGGAAARATAGLLLGGLAVAGCGGAASTAQPDSPPPSPTPTASPTPTPTPAPTAAPPTTPAALAPKVAPAAMAIPSIGIDSRVEPVGADDRVLQIPAQPWVVGWWKDGVGPGQERGTVVLTAHLDSRQYGKGPFVRAVELKAGDAMVLTGADGVAHAYQVQSVDTYRKAALPYAELFDQGSAERVVFVTCGGSYDRRNGGWDSNVVVTFAKA